MLRLICALYATLTCEDAALLRVIAGATDLVAGRGWSRVDSLLSASFFGHRSQKEFVVFHCYHSLPVLFFGCSLILIYLTSQHCSKNAWDSSGGSQALGSIQSSLPQGTKDYLADAQNKVFNRKNLRSPTVFFGLGEEKPFYLERVPSLITERVKHNLSFFYLNYALLTALLFCLTLLISPSAIIGIGLLGFAWMAVIRATAEGSVQIKGESNKFFFITSIHNSSIFSHPLFATYLQELPLLKNKQQ